MSEPWTLEELEWLLESELDCEFQRGPFRGEAWEKHRRVVNKLRAMIVDMGGVPPHAGRLAKYDQPDGDAAA